MIPAEPSKQNATPGEKVYEPSMEEILASIRRIIADDHAAPSRVIGRDEGAREGDPVHSDIAAPSLRAAASLLSATPASTERHAMPPPEMEDDLPPVRAVFAPHPVRADAPPAPQQAAPAATSLPMRSEPVAPAPDMAPVSRVATAGPTTIANPSVLHPTGASAPATPAADQAARSAASSVMPSEAPMSDDPIPLRASQPVAEHGTSPRSANSQATMANERQANERQATERQATERQATERQATERQATERLAARGDGALFSPTTNSSVTAAFNALTATRLVDNDEVLTSMVRDMVRPMLKEWLDDHLPTLVEKLVRAEIERVARGGH